MISLFLSFVGGIAGKLLYDFFFKKSPNATAGDVLSLVNKEESNDEAIDKETAVNRAITTEWLRKQGDK